MVEFRVDCDGLQSSLSTHTTHTHHIFSPSLLMMKSFLRFQLITSPASKETLLLLPASNCQIFGKDNEINMKKTPIAIQLWKAFSDPNAIVDSIYVDIRYFDLSKQKHDFHSTDMTLHPSKRLTNIWDCSCSCNQKCV